MVDAGLRNNLDLMSQAVQCFRAGDLNRAKQITENILVNQPSNFDALHLLGVINAIGGANDEAELLYKKALHINATHEELRVNLTFALVAVGKFEEALISIEKVLLSNRRNAIAHFTHGNILRALKRQGEALASFDRALSINPDYAKAWANRGVTLNELKRYDEAIANFDKALGINPDSVEAWCNRGIAFGALKGYDEALANYDKAISINPESAEAWSNRGNVLGDLKRHGAALASFDKALSINSESAETWSNRGNVLGELKRYGEALACFDKALSIDPRYADAWYNRGIAFSELTRYDEALDSHAQALAIEPDLAYCFGNWLHTKMILCDWGGLEEAFNRALEEIERGRPAFSPFTLLATPAPTSHQKKCAEIYVGDQYGHVTAGAPSFTRHEDKKLRIGYFSADFKAHPVSFLTVGMFEAHDRNRFEICGFGLDQAENDKMRRRVVDAFDQFIDLSASDTSEAIDVVRKTELDIAIDLNGHTSGGRTEILSSRIAPIQINYLGYPGTMGAGFIDYIIADEIVIPREHRIHYAEKVVYLPDSYLVNDGTRRIAQFVPSRAEIGLPQRGFVFCSFNNPVKITPEMFGVWMRLLRQVEDSVLWLTPRNSIAGDNLRREAYSRGVDPDRLIFAARVDSNDEHLARHRLADLFLDTLPYNAHSTAADALWAGLPVLTCIGSTFSGRVGASLLNAIGLPELITKSLEEYEALALELATRPGKLSSLTEKLRRNRSTHPLFDTTLFTKHMESAYTKMWERYRSGLPPDHIYVEA
jgi:predicted O-linked N-acetylglucosamine transferase (SPINDLY family)